MQKNISLALRALIEPNQLASWQAKRADLTKLSQTTDFWQRADAEVIMKDLAELETEIAHWQNINQLSQDLEEVEQLLAETELNEVDRASFLAEEHRLKAEADHYLEKFRHKQFLAGPFDKLGCLFSIHAAQGGTEAMDWAQMLERMYTRYFERKGWKHSLLERSQGEEAGIKSVEYQVEASYAYGLLKHERGAHRLVRQSPFNADNLRQTSFALVEVAPLLPVQSEQIVLPEEQLEWKFSRSSGAGGQNVNKVNTAVELKHLPSGLVVRCREERSQVQNKARALQKLRALLAQREEEARLEQLAREKGQHAVASFGSQIRNYVLHPYHLVKDTRTKVESRDTDAVLDGDLDLFIEANLHSTPPS